MDALPTASRNAASKGVTDLVDAGAGAGRCEILTAADALLVTFTLNDPAFSQGAAGTQSANGLPKTAAATATGTAAKCRVVDSDGTVRFSGTCGVSASDAIIDNTSITNTQNCNLTALNYNQPAS